mmetsp:Transcript_53085/g.153092  ORF Transcript_53085/g.153092 Transcript_53085/m.153092 type:complete len:252 (-) Transcript_53085:189-944(-)
MNAVLRAVELPKPLRQRARPYKRQDHFLWVARQRLHEEADVLLRGHSAHVDHEEGVGDAEGQLASRLGDIRFGLVDTEEVAIHHGAPTLGRDVLLLDARAPQERPRLRGHREVGGAAQAPNSVPPVREPHHCPTGHQSARTIVPCGNLGRVGMDRDDQGHIAKEACGNQDLHRGLLCTMDIIGADPPNDLNQSPQIRDRIAHAEVLLVDWHPSGLQQDMLHSGDWTGLGRQAGLPGGQEVRRHNYHSNAAR